MQGRDLYNLQEAYLEVYDNLNEATRMRKKFKQDTGNEIAAIEKEIGVRNRLTKPNTPKVTIHTKSGRVPLRLSPEHLRQVRQRAKLSDSYELYDTILSYLLDEGYANDLESAEVILENMSEEWIDSIMEEKKPYPVDKVDAKVKELKKKLLATNSSNERGVLTHRLGILLGTRDKKVLEF